MSSDSERLLLFGLLGLIAWELWPKSPAAPGVSMGGDPLSKTPPWVQQLSAAEQLQCDQTEPDALECLLAIPQGPGGSSSFPYVPGGTASPGGFNPVVNFFNPTQGIFSMCNQGPASIARPSLWSIS
jgi:hypothetical protein